MPTVWPPPPNFAPPPESKRQDSGSSAQRRVSLISALGIGSIAGAFLLLPVTGLLVWIAWGIRGSSGLFVVAYLLLVCGIVCSGPAAWILGKEAAADGALSPKQIKQVRTGRLCGMIGLGLLGVEVVICILLLVR